MSKGNLQAKRKIRERTAKTLTAKETAGDLKHRLLLLLTRYHSNHCYKIIIIQTCFHRIFFELIECLKTNYFTCSLLLTEKNYERDINFFFLIVFCC